MCKVTTYAAIEVFKDGAVRTLGPYNTAEYRKRAVLEMMAEGRQVYWLDSHGPASVGRHFTFEGEES